MGADHVVGLDGVRLDIAMMRTPDGHDRLGLTKFHTPTAESAGPENAPGNPRGLRSFMFAVERRTKSAACPAPNVFGASLVSGLSYGPPARAAASWVIAFG
jgi:hypothetical protein